MDGVVSYFTQRKLYTHKIATIKEIKTGRIFKSKTPQVYIRNITDIFRLSLHE